MAFDIKNFSSEVLPGGGARTGLFRISVPNSFNSISHIGDGSHKFEVSCQAASIPAGTIEPVEVAYFGRMFKLPGGRTFDEWATTILVDEDYKSRQFIESWMDQINGNVTNRVGTLGGDYMKDIEVHQYAKTGEITHKYVMVGAWPSSCGEITLDWNETGTIAQFECSWNFQWWESKVISDRTREDILDNVVDIGLDGAESAKGKIEQFTRNTIAGA